MNGQERKEEKWALRILKKLYPDEFCNIEIKDRPDLQDVDRMIGVEVTIACVGNEKAIQQTIHKENKHNSIQGDNNPINQDDVCEKVSERRGEPLRDENGACYGYIIDSSLEQAGELLKTRVEDKQNHLEAYIENSNWNYIDLFIVNQLDYLGIDDYKMKCNELFEYYRTTYSQETSFRNIYIFKYRLCGQRLLLIYNVNTNQSECKTLDISDDELNA